MGRVKFCKPYQMTDKVGGLLLVAGFNELVHCFLILCPWEILQPRQSNSVPEYARRALLLQKGRMRAGAVGTSV